MTHPEPPLECSSRQTSTSNPKADVPPRGILGRIFQWLFGTIDYPKGKSEQIHELAACGAVVYVARAPSTGLALYFNHLIARTRLPPPRFLGGADLWLLGWFRRYWPHRRRNRSEEESAWLARFGPAKKPEESLARTVLEGNHAFLFLPRQRSRIQRSEKTSYDFIRALVAAQRLSASRIFLVPHAVTDHVVAGSSGTRSLGSRLFGDRRRQGRFRQLAMLISPTRQASVRVADTIELHRYIDNADDLDDEGISRRLRHELHRRISDEERVIAGPELPPPEMLTRHVLRSPELRQNIEAAARRSEGARDQHERRAAAHLKNIAARFSVEFVQVWDRLLNWLFHRIYDGIVVDEAGLKRTVELLRRAPLILCPSHRSHIDYLVMSYVLFRNGVTPPHIAAGANLSFFPLGFLFRRAGAFFLRRSFREDQLYAAVFRSYVGELLRHGTTIEFFPEGTRSRTGKTLQPRFGMFSMMVDAWRDGANDDVQFVPVSIDYDRIIEATTYQKELRGGNKRGEDVRGLLKSTKVLRSRYGRVHLQFGQSISLAEMAKNLSLPQDPSPDHNDIARVVVNRLAYRVNHDIARLCTVTPTSVVATAILTHRGRGLAERRLLRRSLAIIEFLDDNAARLSEALLVFSQRNDVVSEAINGLVSEGMIVAEQPGDGDDDAVYRVPEERRIILDYHKNALMNHFAPASIVATSMRIHQWRNIPSHKLRKAVKFLSRLLKREFLFRTDSDFDVYLEDSIASLTLLGLIDFDDERQTVSVVEAESMDLLAGLIDPLLEAYYATVNTVLELHDTPLAAREIEERAQRRARRLFLEGVQRCPESANRTVIKTAIGWLCGEGLLKSEDEPRRGSLAIVNIDKLRQLSSRLEEFQQST